MHAAGIITRVARDYYGNFPTLGHHTPSFLICTVLGAKGDKVRQQGIKTKIYKLGLAVLPSAPTLIT